MDSSEACCVTKAFDLPSRFAIETRLSPFFSRLAMNVATSIGVKFSRWMFSMAWSYSSCLSSMKALMVFIFASFDERNRRAPWLMR